MDVSNPGWGMPRLQADAPGAVLDLGGALRDPGNHPKAVAGRRADILPAEPPRDPEHAAAQIPSSGEPAVLGPPLYGQWYAKQQTVPAADDPPHWFRELNLDPRHRVAAGLGTPVIRFEQEQLMASAWDQLAKQEQDNQRLKRAQLAETVGEALVDKHLQALRPEQFLQVTGPVHAALERRLAARDRSAQSLRLPAARPCRLVGLSSSDSTPAVRWRSA